MSSEENTRTSRYKQMLEITENATRAAERLKKVYDELSPKKRKKIRKEANARFAKKFKPKPDLPQDNGIDMNKRYGL